MLREAGNFYLPKSRCNSIHNYESGREKAYRLPGPVRRLVWEIFDYCNSIDSGLVLESNKLETPRVFNRE